MIHVTFEELVLICSHYSLQNFSLVYLCLGYPRLPPIEQIRLLPTILLSLTFRTQHQNRLFCTYVHVCLSDYNSCVCYICSIIQLCIPALVHLQWPHGVKERCSLLPLTDQPDVTRPLLQFLLLYLLLPYRSIPYICLHAHILCTCWHCRCLHLHI